MDLPLEEDAYYKYTLRNVFDITLERIKKESPEAYEWLNVSVFLNPDCLTKKQIQSWALKQFPGSEGVKKSLAILKVLENYCILQKTPSPDVFSIHGLLVQSIKNKQSVDQQNQLFEKLFHFMKDLGLEKLDNQQKYEQLKTWWSLQFLHLFQDTSLMGLIDNKDRILALQSLSNFNRKIAKNYELALHFAKDGVELSKQVHLMRDEAAFLIDLGYCNLKLGNENEAEEHFLRAFQLRKNSLPEQDPLIVEALICLYVTHSQIKGLNKSFLEIFNGIEAGVLICVKGHDLCATHLQNTAQDLAKTAVDPSEKLKYHEIIVNLRKNLLINAKSEEIPDPEKIADAHNNLGHALVRVGKYSEAKKEAQEAIKMHAHNPQHFNVWVYKATLARAYMGLANSAETRGKKIHYLRKAQNTYLEALRTRNIHPKAEKDKEVAKAYFNLGKIYESYGQRDKLPVAQDYYLKSYEMRKAKNNHEEDDALAKTKEALERVKKKQILPPPSPSWKYWLK